MLRVDRKARDIVSDRRQLFQILEGGQRVPLKVRVPIEHFEGLGKSVERRQLCGRLVQWSCSQVFIQGQVDS